MDPDVALSNWRCARGAARAEAWQVLADWLRHGGFDPRWLKGERAKFWNANNGANLRRLP